MLSTRFNDALDRVLMAFEYYRHVPRNPDNVARLASARLQLDQARAELHEAREQDHPPQPDPPRTAEEALWIWTREHHRGRL